MKKIEKKVAQDQDAQCEYDASATSSLCDILPRERELGLRKLYNEYAERWHVTPEKAKELLQNNYVGRKLIGDAGTRNYWNCKLY